METDTKPPSIPYHLFLIFIVLAIGILFAGNSYYESEKRDLKRVHQSALSAIAQLKIDEISSWLEERRGDAAVIAENDFVARHVQEWFKNPQSSESDTRMLAWMASIKNHYAYEGVFLLDSEGKLRWSLPENEEVDAVELQHFSEVMRTKQPVLADLHRSKVTNTIHFSLLAPLLIAANPGSAPVGVIVLKIDPQKFPFPLIQSWPTPSRTAETLLVRREGNEVLYLNELRHRKGTALSLRLPISDSRLPAAMAVRGEEGIMEGIDYNGVPVVAVTRAVPNSPWYLVSKMELEELYAPVHERAMVIVLLVSLLIMGSGVSIGLIWRHQQSRFYRQQYEAEHERLKLAERYEYLNRYANDIMLMMNSDGAVVEANDLALASYGYTRTELLALNLRDIRAPETLSSLATHMEQIRARKQGGLVFETEHRRKDGTTFPVEVSSRIIRLGEEDLFWSIIRDISERKQVEEALRESQQRLADIIDFLPDATLVIDTEGNVIAWNRALERITGIKATDMLGKGNYEYALPFYGERRPILVDLILEPLEEIEAKYVRMEKSAAFIVGETAIPTLKGGDVYVSATAAALHDSKGSIVGAIESIRDISERRRAEEALREERDKAQRYFDVAGVMLLVIDKDRKVSLINKKGCEILGFSESEILGKDWFEHFVPERMRNEVRAVFEKLVAGEVEPVKFFENPVLTGSGRERIIAWHNTVLTDEAGKVRATLGSGEDITERKRAEEERDRLFNLSLDVLCIAGFDGFFKQVNPAGSRILGWSQEELLLRPWVELVHPDDRYTALQATEQLLAGKSVYSHESRFQCKDGSYRWISWSSFPLPDEGLVLAVARDMTEHKRTEEERYKLEVQLQQAQKMEAIGTLAGGIAHDFNNILAAIMGYTDMALEEASEESVMRSHLKQVLGAAKRAKELTKQILVFSRKGQGGQGKDRDGVSVVLIVKEALRLLRATLPATIEIRQDLVTSPKSLVLADPTQVHQVLMNLCINSGHAMRELGGVLEITLMDLEIDSGKVAQCPGLKPGPYTRLAVSDTGHGMDQATKERIFDPFFTTKGVGEGSGMGLSVVHGIVKSHGGTINVYSEPGVGSTFHVYFPRLVEKAMAASAPALITEIRTGTGRILLVDDEKTLAVMGQRILERLGYEVVAMTSSSEALECFRDQPQRFDLVITDYTMPKMTGIDMSRAMMSIRSDIPIILCTGFSEMITEERAKGMGIRKFIMKPLVMREISEAVWMVLKGNGGADAQDSDH